MKNPTSPRTSATSRHTSIQPSQNLSQRWAQGQAPDVSAFVTESGPLSKAELVAVLHVDQKERWQRGERIPAEHYFSQHPSLAQDPEYGVELVFHEFLLRKELGEEPKVEEYYRRFP